MSAGPSRIEVARRRAAGAKQTAAAVAAVGFLGVLLLAKGGHPGRFSTSAGATGRSSPTTESESEEDDDFDFGSSSVSPATAGAQTQAQAGVS
jgi:hypothetical protein